MRNIGKTAAKRAPFFNFNSCELFGTELEDLCASRANCKFFTSSSDPTAIGMARIKKSEMTGRYEDAAIEYEKLGMAEKAAETRRRIKKTAPPNLNINELVRQLAARGQTLTYFCCHCGTPLEVGAKHEEVLKSCPNCKYDLAIIDLAKLINQHL